MILPDAPGSGLFPPQTCLVDVPVVRALRALSADQVQSAVDEGRLRFVFQVGVSGRRAMICELRFWLKEVLNPAAVANLNLQLAVASMLGERRMQWRGVEVSQLLLVSRAHIHRLNRSRALPGKLKGKTLWIGRLALEKFLIERCYLN